MLRRICFALLVCLFAASTKAHFVFVVPQPGGAAANVIISEDLKPDEDVDISIVAGARLTLKNAAGHETPLKLVKAEHAYTVPLTGEGTRIIHGVADLGVTKRGNAKPFLLVYHPKTIVGDAFDPKAMLGDAAIAEFVPMGKPGELKLKLLIKGKPASAVEVNLVLPDGKAEKLKTDAQGLTPVLTQRGRYGAWARYFDTTAAGDRDGQHFDETRHYPTIVADIPATPAAAAYAPLPEAVSSFGAVAANGWMYVYGGHTAPTHDYSTTAVSARFHRLNLTDGKTWEELAGGPAIQGMNLATYKGKVYRVGGMQPRNQPGEKADNYSITDAACFDPATGKWEALPPLPMPRSSHDLVVIDDKLIVLGGWNMLGKTGGNDWLGNMLVLDLATPGAQWKTIKQPFERRALIAAVSNGKVYVVGGFDDQSEPSRRVEIYDPKADAWTQGPDLPGKQQNGFSPAACAVDGRVYVSVADGAMFRLNESGKAWDKIATTTPRIVHRLIPNGSQILVVGGATKGDNLNLIEVVETQGVQANEAIPAAGSVGAAAR